MHKSSFLLLISALILAACEDGNRSAEPAELQISGPAKILEASAGNEFKLVIESNPTTGFHWELVEHPNPSVMRLISKVYRGDEPVLPV